MSVSVEETTFSSKYSDTQGEDSQKPAQDGDRLTVPHGVVRWNSKEQLYGRQDSVSSASVPLQRRLAESGVAGFRPIFEHRSHPARRALWSVLIVGAVVFAIYQIYVQTDFFLGNPVTISIDVTTPPSIRFPQVVICNQNQERRSQMDVGVEEVCGPSHSGIPCDEYYINKAQQFSSALILCKWLDENCSASDFSTIFTSKGVCFAFNADPPYKEVNSAATDYGLEVFLWANYSEYSNHTEDTGFLVGVSTPHEPRDMTTDLISVPTGFCTRIGFHYSKMEELPPPWGDCGSRDLRFHQPYSHAACHLECKVLFIHKECECYPFYAKQLNSLDIDDRLCSNQTDRECERKFEDKFYDERMPCVHGQCLADCDQVTYEVVNSLGRPGDGFISRLSTRDVASGRDWLQWQQNLVGITVSARGLETTVVRHQRAYSLIALLCDVGGTLGLLLGASVYTLLEALDFCLVPNP